jgi:hypothetical protein
MAMDAELVDKMPFDVTRDSIAEPFSHRSAKRLFWFGRHEGSLATAGAHDFRGKAVQRSRWETST